ncbi:MAG: hypothetical protein IPH04_08585 [Saprospirales bacterium]|nr:hypothetical protein [Saprospirales bacterium]
MASKLENNFPDEWQEVFLPDEEIGEKHIADILTIHGIVIEFQHSHINPQERFSREKFYKNLTWVVDGTRLKTRLSSFLKRKNLSDCKERSFSSRLSRRILSFRLA